MTSQKEVVLQFFEKKHHQPPNHKYFYTFVSGLNDKNYVCTN